MHSIKRVLLGCTLLVLISAVPVLAAEESHEGGIFIGDLGNAIWTFVVFLLVLIVLGKFAWGPMLSGLRSREDYIRKSLEDAKSERLQAEKMLADYTNRIRHAHEEAAAVVEEARRDAEETRKRIALDAKRDADAAVERAKREIQLARNDAVQRIYSEAAALATVAAGKLIQRELTSSDQASLIDASLEELGGTNN